MRCRRPGFWVGFQLVNEVHLDGPIVQLTAGPRWSSHGTGLDVECNIRLGFFALRNLAAGFLDTGFGSLSKDTAET